MCFDIEEIKMILKQWIGIVIILSSFAFGADETFAKAYGYETSYKEAQVKAIQANKPMMILFVTASCPWCQKLENQTLKKESIVKLIQSHFVPVFLDKETDDFPKALTPMVVPTIVFLTPKEGTKFDEIIGYKPADEFLSLLERIIKKVKS